MPFNTISRTCLNSLINYIILILIKVQWKNCSIFNKFFTVGYYERDGMLLCTYWELFLLNSNKSSRRQPHKTNKQTSQINIKVINYYTIFYAIISSYFLFVFFRVVGSIMCIILTHFLYTVVQNHSIFTLRKYI